MTNATNRVLPFALAEAEKAAWGRLTCDELLARYREYLAHPTCEKMSAAHMADILRQARGAARRSE